MQLYFMGFPVCHVAFMALTGLDKHALERARTARLADPPRFLPMARGELHVYLCGMATARIAISARPWLQTYAQKNGDFHPHDGHMMLPAGHKSLLLDNICSGLR